MIEWTGRPYVLLPQKIPHISNVCANMIVSLLRCRYVDDKKNIIIIDGRHVEVSIMTMTLWLMTAYPQLLVVNFTLSHIYYYISTTQIQIRTTQKKGFLSFRITIDIVLCMTELSTCSCQLVKIEKKNGVLTTKKKQIIECYHLNSQHF